MAETQSLIADPAAPLAAPRFDPIAVLIEQRAREAGTSPAVEADGQAFTYAELWERAESIARAVAAATPANARVAVSGPRCFGLVATLLGALASRRTIVPLDPALPEERRRLLVEIADPKLFIAIDSNGSTFGRPLLEVGRDGTAVAAEATMTSRPLPADDAYVFFTSGTTGVPKAVLGTHAGLSHFLAWQRQTFAVRPGDRVGQLTGLSFDVVLRDVFLPLVSGATLCMPRQSTLDGRTVLPWLAESRITLLHAVPAVVRSWLRDVEQPPRLHELRAVFFAGEPLTDALVKSWRERTGFAGAAVNLYGPTETTLAKCWYVVPEEMESGVQPIGTELPNTQVLVVGPDGSLCPPGIDGELVIRTPFATRGYLNSGPEDKARFRPNTFAPDGADMLYWTGDLGCRRTDGILEILGRVDDQVKIRGVRVSPAETEAALARLPTVRDVAVAAYDRLGEPRLAAFVVVGPGLAPPSSRELAQELPMAAVPDVIVSVDRIPLTTNGKVDRAALVEKLDELESPRNGHATAPALDDVEQTILAAWEAVLEQSGLSADDDFFDLGGESLAAMRIATQVAEELGCRCRPDDLFKYPTVADLGRVLRGRRSAVHD